VKTRLEDADGIDGPFDRAMDRAIQRDSQKRQAIAIVRDLKADGGVVQPPVPSVPREDDAITSAFNAARATVAELEAKRIEPMTDITWSPAQHVRRAS
jgi:hypothetical protein